MGCLTTLTWLVRSHSQWMMCSGPLEGYGRNHGLCTICFMSSIRIYDCTFNITPIWWSFSKLKFAQTVIHVWRQKRSVCPHTHAVMDIGTKSEQNMQKDSSWTRNMCMYTCAEMKWNGIIAYRRVRCTYKQGKCVSICAEKKCSTECSKICRCSEMECAAATAGHDLPKADLRCILSYQKMWDLKLMLCSKCENYLCGI